MKLKLFSEKKSLLFESLKVFGVGLMCLLFFSCATAGKKHVQKAANRIDQTAENQRDYYDERWARQDQKLQEVTEGSLWMNSYSSNLFHNMHRASQIGDNVTIMVEESSEGLGSGKTKGDRKSEHSAGVDSLFTVVTRLTSLLGKSLKADELIKAKTESKFQGDGSTQRKGELKAKITASVMRVMQNGNMLVKGEHHMKLNSEEQVLIVEGIIRPYDIMPDNTVSSTKLADARITYSGFGVVAERQRPGWLVRALDYVWPF